MYVLVLYQYITQDRNFLGTVYTEEYRVLEYYRIIVLSYYIYYRIIVCLDFSYYFILVHHISPLYIVSLYTLSTQSVESSTTRAPAIQQSSNGTYTVYTVTAINSYIILLQYGIRKYKYISIVNRRTTFCSSKYPNIQMHRWHRCAAVRL